MHPSDHNAMYIIHVLTTTEDPSEDWAVFQLYLDLVGKKTHLRFFPKNSLMEEPFKGVGE